MPRERRQFVILWRDFLFRMVDLELLSSHGDIRKLLGQFVAMLAAFSFVLLTVTVPRYVGSRLSPERLAVAAWGDEEFLIATTMVVIGMFAVVAWNAVLPDRADRLVLGLLPIRPRTIFAAKVTAMFTALGISAAAVNLFTGAFFPHVIGGLRAVMAYWTTMAAAGLFVFFVLLAMQGLAALLLSDRWFLRASAILQLSAFFLIVSLYFLTPPLATPAALADPGNQSLLDWLPSYWFLGLYQQLSGTGWTLFAPLAARAEINFAAAFAVAAITYVLTFYRHMRRIVEQPDIAPGDRSRPASRLGVFAVRKLVARPLDRAILLFTARTLARARQHRFLLAFYGGVGLAMALTYAKQLVFGYGRWAWNQVSLPGLIVGVVLLTFAVAGARAVFVFPIALRANWIFRITAVHSPAAYFASVRRALLAVAVAPVWVASAAVYLFIWPGRPAAEHLAVLAVTGVLLVDLVLHQFRKIPFACSYLPGGANLPVKLGLYAIAFMTFLSAGTAIESFALVRFARFLLFLAVLTALAVWAWRRRAECAALPHNRIQFEDVPPVEVSPLDLHADTASFGEESYLDLTGPLAPAPLKSRFQRAGLGLLLLLICGAAYDRIGEWRDRRQFPQVGRSVDIGGRLLNLYCSGAGSPAVIFDAAHGLPGYSWLVVQREVARMTRACWYDRAGSGWSDPAPHANTIPWMARDLHTLLQNARVPGPYLLVGASMGGFNIRVFHTAYPREVAGLVFVDASHEDVLAWIPDVPTRRPPEILRRPAVHVASALGWFGLIRLLSSDPRDGLFPAGGFSPHEAATLAFLKNQPKSRAAEINESGGAALPANARALQAARDFGNLPVVVLTAGIGLPPPEQQLWIRLQATLAAWSTQGRQIVVDNSGHAIWMDRPDAVIDAVREVLAATRGAGALPAVPGLVSAFRRSLNQPDRSSSSISRNPAPNRGRQGAD